MEEALEKLQEEYKTLCEKRDATNGGVASLLAERDEYARIAMEANSKAVWLSEQINKRRGGEEWLNLKKKIGRLASAIMELKRR